VKIEWLIDPGDVARVRRFFDQHKNSPLVKKRIAALASATESVTEDQFWQVLVSCLLTTQQPSGPKSAVSKFIRTDPFPLAWPNVGRSGH
jgi:hypothetical protein